MMKDKVIELKSRKIERSKQMLRSMAQMLSGKEISIDEIAKQLSISIQEIQDLLRQ